MPLLYLQIAYERSFSLASHCSAQGRSYGHRANTYSPVSCQLQRKQLGRDGPSVPSICLGTMFYGGDVPAQAAHEMLSTATERGCNFFDCAEMYPVPQAAGTAGQSEQVLGQWLQGRARDSVLIATKVAGPGQMPWIRGGPASLDAANIKLAAEGSLQRLKTDYIDLLQLHWPDRYVPMFGEVVYEPGRAYSFASFEEQLAALDGLVRAGKVRHVGLSNETPWGLTKFCTLGSKAPGTAAITALQNAYSLLCRTFEAGLAECCHHEGVGVLAYSPLAMGILTGKYTGARAPGPAEARLNKYAGRYAEAEARYGLRPAVRAAAEAYVALAREHRMAPAELGLRFVLSHPLVASAVVGASTLQQLHELLDAAEQGPLSDQALAAVDAVHGQWPNPCP